MTSIDHFAIATEILGKQCMELSRPPHDVRFGNPHGLVSVDCTTGRWRTTAPIRVGGKTVEMSGHYLKELGEIKDQLAREREQIEQNVKTRYDRLLEKAKKPKK